MKKIGIYALDYGGAFNLFVYLKERKLLKVIINFYFFYTDQQKNVSLF